MPVVRIRFDKINKQLNEYKKNIKYNTESVLVRGRISINVA